MVNSKLYYERKQAKLCTKCGLPLNDSPSTIRCKICHEAHKQNNQNYKNKLKSQNLCLGCRISQPTGNSNYCYTCRQQKYDLQKIKPETKVLFKEENEHCRICNKLINTIGIICQDCLNKNEFTKKDALTRYGHQCATCNEKNFNKLRIVSSNIELPMKECGPQLYKKICFSISTPKEYRIQCYSCYWKEDLLYIKNTKNILENDNIESNNIINIEATNNENK